MIMIIFTLLLLALLLSSGHPSWRLFIHVYENYIIDFF